MQMSVWYVYCSIFTGAKIWKQPKCLSTRLDTQTDRRPSTPRIIIDHDKEGNVDSCGNLTIQRDYYTKCNKPGLERQILEALLRGSSKQFSDKVRA